MVLFLYLSYCHSISYLNKITIIKKFLMFFIKKTDSEFKSLHNLWVYNFTIYSKSNK